VSEAVGRIRAAYVEGSRRRALSVQGGEIIEVDGLVVALTNLPDPALNGVVVSREPDDPDAAISAAEEEFHRRGHPFFGIELERGRHPAVQEAVRRAGLTLLFSHPAMAARPADLPGPTAPAGLRIERLEDPSELPALQAVDLDAFGADPDVTARFLGLEMLASVHNRVFLAREDGHAIGAGTAWSLLGTVGIFGIGVVGSARGRGIGTALTLTAARSFGDDVDLAWLHPTALARPLYERLGFRAVGDWDIWVRPS
jgi:ribosomal protein S18 acetylase RimI-like enzyme